VRLIRHTLHPLIVGLVTALILIFNVRPLHDGSVVAAPEAQVQKQTYVFLNILGTGQLPDELERLRVQFSERIRARYSNLDVTFDNRSWLTTTTCSKGHTCDFITMDLKDEQLLIRCAKLHGEIVRLPSRVGGCPHEKSKCIQGLPLLLPGQLSSHDEFHRTTSK
jgi:hypothetical protein